MKDIKFVYFDFGGVMAHWKPSVPKFAEIFGVAEEDLFTTLYDHFPQAVRGHITTNEMWRRIKEDMKVDHHHDNYADLFAEFFVPISETHQFAHELKDRGYQVGIMSNIEPDTLKHSRERGHMGTIQFDAMIESHHTGWIKPELQMFRVAQKAAGVHSHEIFFTDDLMENVDAAKKMGWHALQFDSFNPQTSIAEIKAYLEW